MGCHKKQRRQEQMQRSRDYNTLLLGPSLACKHLVALFWMMTLYGDCFNVFSTHGFVSHCNLFLTYFHFFVLNHACLFWGFFFKALFPLNPNIYTFIINTSLLDIVSYPSLITLRLLKPSSKCWPLFCFFVCQWFGLFPNVCCALIHMCSHLESYTKLLFQFSIYLLINCWAVFGRPLIRKLLLVQLLWCYN